jgi:pimeloyl-ACP methyl ester carboxylesterase
MNIRTIRMFAAAALLAMARHALAQVSNVKRFGWYRAVDSSSAQNQRRNTRRLALTVLAIGGEKSSGAGTANAMKLVADDVETVVISGSGHWVAEEAPEPLLAALRAFLAPDRDGLPSAR